jgi:hypothetical protein
MRSLRRTAVTGGVSVGLVATLFWAGAAPVSALGLTNQADVLVGGWGDNPALVMNATWTTILINRDFTPSSGLGRTIFVDLEMSDAL